MPIDAPSTPVTILVPQTVQASRLHIDSIRIDATGELAGNNPPSLAMAIRLYAEDKESQARTYAADAETIRTNDLYAVSAKIPAVAVAMGAIFAAVKDIQAYRAARKGESDKAAETESAARADVATKQAILDGKPSPESQADVDAAKAALVEASRRATVARLAYADPANEALTS